MNPQPHQLSTLTTFTKNESDFICFSGIWNLLISTSSFKLKMRTEGDCRLPCFPSISVTPLSTTHKRSHSSTKVAQEREREKKKCSGRLTKIVMNHLERQSLKRCLDLDLTSSVARIDSSSNSDTDVNEGIFRLRLRCNSKSLPLPFATFAKPRMISEWNEKKV